MRYEHVQDHPPPRRVFLDPPRCTNYTIQYYFLFLREMVTYRFHMAKMRHQIGHSSLKTRSKALWIDRNETLSQVSFASSIHPSPYIRSVRRS